MVTMELDKAIAFVKNYQEWRRGAETPMPNPKEISIAIDTLLNEIEKCKKELKK